ncbi:MAG TPA: apolipoprotein acyltransferase, partial [Pseudolabrys sp.]|nr:apolipoprotein acyltransferase [Pseudolabrys sp.]
RDIARVVSDSSAEGTRTVAEQFEQIREATEEQFQRALTLSQEQFSRVREATEEQFERMRNSTSQESHRTAQTMRAIFEETTGSTDAIFSEANERFGEAVRGMKQMATDLQRELETTRAELRRGILELPQEASESASQMRRVVLDQIEALAELNRIVARHGRTLDSVEPTRRTEPARTEPLLSVAIGNRAETPRATTPHVEPIRTTVPAARAPEPTRQEPAAYAPRPEPTPLQSRSEPAAFAPRRSEASPSAGNGNRGWLSDLLNRASRDDGEPLSLRDNSRDTGGRDLPRRETREPATGIESLDALSVDIARMVDHDAVADLWDRYKRGDRNVFTRRLYTLQGQKAFDEIRGKYRNNRDFKQTVDRYIIEFEQLLDDASRDERGQTLARSYLTSETGKVYTLLAHASGRFE